MRGGELKKITGNRSRFSCGLRKGIPRKESLFIPRLFVCLLAQNGGVSGAEPGMVPVYVPKS